ncbi:MAG: VOC family protein [Tetrasphaera jenkinsii]|jgi:catechol 2,3-dioxygenase-like lactoylglutathione lyase family enzyme|nr:VOC family protein [Tetrasphaera jenkinsii]
MTGARPDVFGAVQLGYLVVETQRFPDWRRFGADALGLHVDDVASGATRFRIDDHACRLLLTTGPTEDVTAIGWQIADHEVFDTILARVADAGQPIAEGTEEECALRGVERLWRFAGPKGMATEIFTTPVTTTAPLRMLQEAFVTGDAGMGHVAITAARPEEVRGYYTGLFDARLSDWVHENIAGTQLRIRFLRVNERHHSVAVAGVRGLPIDPIRTSIQHLNTQVATLDGMLAAYERVISTGFEWELGWNPIVVTPDLEETWAPKTYDSISIWGHTPIGEGVLTRLNQFRYAARSLRYRKPTLPKVG